MNTKGKCTFCPADATQFTTKGLPICKDCSDAVPSLVGKDDKSKNLADLILTTMRPKLKTK